MIRAREHYDAWSWRFEQRILYIHMERLAKNGNGTRLTSQEHDSITD